MNKKLLLLTIAVLCLTTFASADSFTTYPTRIAQNPDDFFDWNQLGPDYVFSGKTIPSPASVTSFNGNMALVGNTNGGDFLRLDEGVGWSGSFDDGEALLWTGNSISAVGLGGGGPFAVVFQHPVSSVGFGIEADLFVPYTATTAVYDTMGNLLFTYTINGVPGCGSGAGCEPFVGIGDLSAPNIGEIVISSNSGDPNFANDFAIDAISTATTPEPGTIALLGSGLIGIAGVLRRKLAR